MAGGRAAGRRGAAGRVQLRLLRIGRQRGGAAGDRPETELHEVTHSVVRGGRLVAEISAEHVQNFPRQRYALLDEVRYVEYDAAGAPVTTGSAERAVFYSEREDAKVAGAIRLRSESQGVSLEASRCAGRGRATGWSRNRRWRSHATTAPRCAPAAWTWTCAASGSASPPP